MRKSSDYFYTVWQYNVLSIYKNESKKLKTLNRANDRKILQNLWYQGVSSPVNKCIKLLVDIWLGHWQCLWCQQGQQLTDPAPFPGTTKTTGTESHSSPSMTTNMTHPGREAPKQLFTRPKQLMSSIQTSTPVHVCYDIWKSHCWIRYWYWAEPTIPDPNHQETTLTAHSIASAVTARSCSGNKLVQHAPAIFFISERLNVVVATFSWERMFHGPWSDLLANIGPSVPSEKAWNSLPFLTYPQYNSA